MNSCDRRKFIKLLGGSGLALATINPFSVLAQGSSPAARIVVVGGGFGGAGGIVNFRGEAMGTSPFRGYAAVIHLRQGFALALGRCQKTMRSRALGGDIPIHQLRRCLGGAGRIGNLGENRVGVI